ncbi:MAG: RNA polymerase sigma factor RpoD/SigA [Cyanobacteria bacterium REEB67]|nr:RNA polymerase sigma factor RpoD/SigA [Cyanobacteria bacterium REEB67]
MPQTRATNKDETASAFAAYMAQARQIPFLSAEEEIELAKKIQAGGPEADTARNALVKSQLRMVVSMAYKQVRPSVTLEDLIQEGNLGLFRAADKFDHTMGFRFFTYARGWVKAAIGEYLNTNSFALPVPSSSARKLGNIKRAEIKLARDGRRPTEEQVATELRMRPSTVRYLNETSQAPISMSSPIFDGDGEFGDRIEDTDAVNPEAALIEGDFVAKITSALDKLNERERQVLVGRFNLDGEGVRTLEDLAQIYGVSRERIRQIEAKALDKLKSGQTGALLRTFL